MILGSARTHGHLGGDDRLTTSIRSARSATMGSTRPAHHVGIGRPGSHEETQRVNTFEGGHFFLHSARDELLARISDELRALA